MLSTDRTKLRKIEKAAAERFPRKIRQLDFEHGQWWLTLVTSGAQYSVVDANTKSGLDFELVTEPKEY